MIVLWRVTEVCNLACGFCAYDRRVERSRNGADPEQVRRFARLLGLFHRRTGERVMLSWLGGEPLLVLSSGARDGRRTPAPALAPVLATALRRIRSRTAADRRSTRRPWAA